MVRLQNLPSSTIASSSRDLGSILLFLLSVVLGVGGFIALFKLRLPWDPALSNEIAERHLIGRSPTVQQYVDLSMWWAALFSCLAGFGLAAASRLWTARSRPLVAFNLPEQKNSYHRSLVWCLLISITLASAVIRSQRLDHSFWNDEETTMQDYAWGEYKRPDLGDPVEPLKFKPIKWSDTLFYNRGGSNHILNSAVTKITLDTWYKVTGRNTPYFSEIVARIIPFLASIATILLLGWAAWRAHSPITGIVAAATLGLNPWHLRYSTEIRGYSLMLFLIVVSVVFFYLALNTGKRRYWLGFALAEAGFMLAFMASIYVAATINLAALAAIMAWSTNNKYRLLGVARLAAYNLFAAVLFVVLVAPSIPQFADYLENPLIDGFAPNWFGDFYHHLTLGIPPWNVSAESNLGLTAPQLFSESPWIEPLVFRVIPVILVIGFIAYFSKQRVAFLFVTALVSAPLLSYLHNRISDSPALPWYLLYAVLPFALLCGAMSTCPDWLPGLHPRKRQLASITIAIVWLGVYGVATQPSRSRLCEVPRQPLRGVAEAMRGNSPTYAAPINTDEITGSIGFSIKRLRSYDPHIFPLKNVAELRKLVQAADHQNRPSVIAACGGEMLLDDDADAACLAFLNDPKNGFFPAEQILGFEEQFSYQLYRRPASKLAGEREN